MGVSQQWNKQQVLGKCLNTLWDEGLRCTVVVGLILGLQVFLSVLSPCPECFFCELRYAESAEVCAGCLLEVFGKFFPKRKKGLMCGREISLQQVRHNAFLHFLLLLFFN